MKCPNCGYEWEYTGKLQYVTCPNCMRKFNPQKEDSEVEDERNLR